MKKLLTTLLSVLMLCTLATTNVFADITTVQDVLNTVDGGFPTSEEDAWVAENGQKVYDNGNNLYFEEPVESAQLAKNGDVTLSGSNYVRSPGSWTATFNMESGKLVSITYVNNFSHNLDGTYYPPVKPDAKDVELEYELAASYEWSVPQKVTISTNDSTIDVAVTSVTLADGEKIKITVASTNEFKVKNGSTELSYKLGKDNTYNPAIANDDVVLETDVVKTQTLYAKLNAAGTKAGKYTDTLTFTASIEPAPLVKDPGLYNDDGFTPWETLIEYNVIKLTDDGTTLDQWNVEVGPIDGELIIDSSINKIDDYAFEYTYLTAVFIPGNVTYIGDNAFGHGESLSSITFGGTKAQWSNVTIGECAFYEVAATVVHCTDGNVAIEQPD